MPSKSKRIQSTLKAYSRVSKPQVASRTQNNSRTSEKSESETSRNHDRTIEFDEAVQVVHALLDKNENVGYHLVTFEEYKRKTGGTRSTRYESYFCA